MVTLGTQKFQMDRLIKAMDDYAIETCEDVFIQTGHSTYVPAKARHKDFLDAETYDKLIGECELLVTHSGVGTIMAALNNNTPVVVVPRLKQYGEHVDDNQKEIAEAFALKEHVVMCEDINDLPLKIEEAKRKTFKPYISKGEKIETLIIDFIEAL